MDNELSVRAGLNIGIEPTLLPFVQAGVENAIPIALSGDTVLAEHTENAARVLFGGAGFGTGLGGWAYNTDPALIGAALLLDFVDDLGNRIQLGGANLVFGGTNPLFVFLQKFGGFFCLAPDEMIVAKFQPSGP